MEKRRLQRVCMVALQYLKRTYKKDGLSSVMIAQENDFELKEGRYMFDIRNKIFMITLVSH